MILMTSTIQGELLSIAEQMWIHRRGAADAAAASGWRYFRKSCHVVAWFFNVLMFLLGEF